MPHDDPWCLKLRVVFRHHLANFGLIVSSRILANEVQHPLRSRVVQPGTAVREGSRSRCYARFHVRDVVDVVSKFGAAGEQQRPDKPPESFSIFHFCQKEGSHATWDFALCGKPLLQPPSSFITTGSLLCHLRGTPSRPTAPLKTVPITPSAYPGPGTAKCLILWYRFPVTKRSTNW